MPLDRYNRYFGGGAGSADKAAKALQKEYGPEKGRGVFYAIVKKRQRIMKQRGLKTWKVKTT
jgi:hypothetical protein